MSGEVSAVPLQNLNTHFSLCEKVGLWIHEHHTIVKVMEVALLVLGGMLIAAIAAFPVIGLAAAISLAVVGAIFTLAASVALLGLDILVPPHHDMASHAYRPGRCEGGELYYEGDVPVLSLEADDPFKAGQAQGYLCGDAINHLSKRFDFVLHTLGRWPRAEQLPQTIAAVRATIPDDYLREIEGLVEGYGRWAAEQCSWICPKTLTVDDLILFHLMPDSLHFSPQAFEAGQQQAPRDTPFGCTAIVERDPVTGIKVARDMDWISLGLAGIYSLVIQHNYTTEGYSTVGVGFAGFVGLLTGMNNKGLVGAMNVCQGITQEVRGMPAAFWNRECLKRCQNVREVKEHAAQKGPLGSYHWTVADRLEAEVIHFYQSEQPFFSRTLPENEPLVTLNYRYHQVRRPMNDVHHSTQRQRVIDNFFAERGNAPLEEALALPYVNNWLTTHKVVMIPGATPEEAAFEVAFDNAFAGKAPLQAVPLQRLFAF